MVSDDGSYIFILFIYTFCMMSYDVTPLCVKC